ncbi:MAG TPA: hypothetical protein VH877_21845 [Polyangia bacterium]|jgi:hypothetical protein|nr:hypothetical protein [Polyangia bacterium]
MRASDRGPARSAEGMPEIAQACGPVERGLRRRIFYSHEELSYWRMRPAASQSHHESGLIELSHPEPTRMKWHGYKSIHACRQSIQQRRKQLRERSRQLGSRLWT